MRKNHKKGRQLLERLKLADSAGCLTANEFLGISRGEFGAQPQQYLYATFCLQCGRRECRCYQHYNYAGAGA